MSIETLNERKLLAGDTEVILNSFGALVKEFNANGLNILYPDRAVGSKRRGRIPIIYHNAGPSPKAGPLSCLPQHGFARDWWWNCIDQDSNFLLRYIHPNPKEGNLYASFNSLVELKLSLAPHRIKEILTISNEGVGILPIAPGFHPYLVVDEYERPSIKTNIPNFDPNHDYSTATIFSYQDEVRLTVPSKGEIYLRASENLKKLVIWEGLGYFCIEPWMDGPGAITDNPCKLYQYQIESFWLEMEYQPL